MRNWILIAFSLSLVMVAAQGCKKKPEGETNVTVTTDGTNPDALAMGDTDVNVDIEGAEPVEGNGSAAAPEGGEEKPATDPNKAAAPTKAAPPTKATPPKTTPPAQTNSNSGSQSNASTPAGTYTAQVNNEFRNMMREAMKQQGGEQMTEEMLSQMMAMMEQQIAGMKLTLNPGGDFIMNMGMAGEIKGNWTVSGDNVSMVAKTFVNRSSGSPVEEQAPPDQQEPQIAKWSKSAGTLTVDQGGMALTFKKA